MGLWGFGDLAEDVGDPSQRFDMVEPDGADQSIDRWCAHGAAVGTGELLGGLPRTIPLSARSAALFDDKEMRPSSRNRAKPAQRVSM